MERYRGRESEEGGEGEGDGKRPPRAARVGGGPRRHRLPDGNDRDGEETRATPRSQRGGRSSRCDHRHWRTALGVAGLAGSTAAERGRRAGGGRQPQPTAA